MQKIFYTSFSLTIALFVLPMARNKLAEARSSSAEMPATTAFAGGGKPFLTQPF